MSALRTKPRRLALYRNEGFNLIELLVVVAIVAILAVIAIPTYLGSRSRANDGTAQQTTRQALEYAQSQYLTNGNNYSDFSNSGVLATAHTDTGLAWTVWTTASISSKTVSAETTTSIGATSTTGLKEIELCTLSPTPGGSGDYFCVLKNNSDSTSALRSDGTSYNASVYCRFTSIQLPTVLQADAAAAPWSGCRSW